MTKKKSKTIAIFSGYAIPHLGGVERYTENLKNELIKNNYKVIIISANYDFSNNYMIKDKNVVYIKLPVYKLFIKRYPIIKHNYIYKKLIKELDKYDISNIIVNTRFYLTSLIGAKYGHKNNIPVSLIEHGSQHLTVDNKILDFFGAIYEHLLTIKVKKYVNYYYGVSKGACNWQKHFKINSNGIWYNSIVDFSKNAVIEKEKNNIIHITYAGRILKQKGIIQLLEVFTKLEKKHENIMLTIAGDGNLLDYCKEKYKSPKIKFLGNVDFEQLKKIYSITDIFVYAPIWPEGLPTSILEAGLMKCATIASPYGGTKEIIKNNVNGILITSEEELENSIIKLIENKKLRTKYGNELYKTIKSKFLWNVTANKIIKDIEGYNNDEK